MAQEYFKKLLSLIERLNIEKDAGQTVEVKHFFSGAALYVNNTLCASWSPVGLAFKLPEKEVSHLINSGEARPLKYFPKGHVKKAYALFEAPETSKPERWEAYLIKAIKGVLN